MTAPTVPSRSGFGGFSGCPPDRHLPLLVDPRGFEPLTFWLPARRGSTVCGPGKALVTDELTRLCYSLNLDTGGMLGRDQSNELSSVGARRDVEVLTTFVIRQRPGHVPASDLEQIVDVERPDARAVGRR